MSLQEYVNDVDTQWDRDKFAMNLNTEKYTQSLQVKNNHVITLVKFCKYDNQATPTHNDSRETMSNL